MKLLKRLLEEVEMVNLQDNSVVPNDPVRRGEKVLGTLPEDLQRLYVVVTTMGKGIEKHCDDVQSRVNAHIEELQAAGRAQLDPKIREELTFHNLAHQRHDTALSLFWFSVSEQFPQTETLPDTLALRAGWQVVAVPPAVSALNTIEDMFGDIRDQIAKRHEKPEKPEKSETSEKRD